MCAVFAVDNGLDRITCSIQDTPGYGDGLDIRAQIEDVVEHIRQLDHAHFLQEMDANNRSSNHSNKNNHAQRQMLDNRVDACLYFVPPHRLKEIDLAYMRRLSDVVSIIPIIGKADTMTEAELIDYKQHVLTRYVVDLLSQQLLQPVGEIANLTFGFVVSHSDSPCHRCIERSIRLASFEDETLQRVKWYADGPILPFAIVASNECDHAISGDSDAFWPVRRYSWGVCQAFHREHSDCYWLRRVVIEEGFFDLKRDSNLRYTIFRNAQLQLQKPMHVKLWQRLLQLFRAPCSKQILLQEEQEMQDMMMRRQFLSQVTGPSIHDTPALLHVHDACPSPAAQHQATTPNV